MEMDLWTIAAGLLYEFLEALDSLLAGESLDTAISTATNGPTSHALPSSAGLICGFLNPLAGTVTVQLSHLASRLPFFLPYQSKKVCGLAHC